MANPPSFDFFTADFIEGVRLLEPDEVGAYALLLCHQWQKGHIPETESQRMKVAQVICPDQWLRIWASIRHKFIVIDLHDICDSDPTEPNRHVFANARMHNDREEYFPRWKHRKEVNRNNRLGKKGKKRTTNGKRMENDSLTNREGEGEGEGEGEIRKKKTSRYSEDFERFWAAFPRGRRTAKGEAWKRWKVAIQDTDAETIIAASVEYAASEVGNGQYVKSPAPWLNGRCWEDDRTAWSNKTEAASKKGRLRI